LFTSAGTFAGQLTGNRRWFRFLRESISAVGGDGVELAKELAPIDETIAAANAIESSFVGYIHLDLR
jgi:hypothetical protein